MAPHRVDVYSPGSTLSSKVWFWTEPLDEAALARIAAVQLITTSCDQGWVSDPDTASYSWFQIGVFTPTYLLSGAGPAKSNDCANISMFLKDYEDTRWLWSHHNPIAHGTPKHLSGRITTMEDAIWDNVAVGDVIAVRACAQYPGWQNKAESGEIRVWKWFEPVIHV